MNFYIDFAFILTMTVIITGIISGIDKLFFAKKRRLLGKKLPKIVDYSYSFFPVLLLVWVIRSFVVQPYRVPTGSLEPTVMPGDFIAVNQFTYGLRLPVLNKKIIAIDEPKIGDIVLFRLPSNPKVTYVKRVIGTPLDNVVYKDKVLYINGEKAQQVAYGLTDDIEPGMLTRPSIKKQENLQGIKHDILVAIDGGYDNDFALTVPKDMYFMMGDNRDNSYDSRFWGFVPEKNIVGKAFLVWMNWDSGKYRIRWHRIGTKLYN